nr:DnaT-like ssDNA-binding protein [Pseudomonas sp. UBA6718]
MALTIEDGSIVAGADSYVEASDLVTYAGNYGRTIPADTSAQESLLRRAYLQMAAMPWKGAPVSVDQTGAWPRYDVCRNGFALPSDSIPAQIKQGQMALATEIHADDLVDPSTKLGAITREKVGPLETEYAEAKGYAAAPAAMRQSYAQFAGLLESSTQPKLVRG